MTNIQEVINRFDEKFDAPLAQWTETAIKDFLTSELTTLIEKQRITVSWDIADGGDNWVVQFWANINGVKTLIQQLDKNSDDAGSFDLDQVLSLKSLQV